MYSLIKKIDNLIGLPTAQAHCDIPCKIYDPSTAQIAALSVVRFLDLIQEIDQKDSKSTADLALLSRLVREKEIHAGIVKDEVRVIWGDFIKAPQLEKFPNTHELVHSIMLKGSACKQHIDRSNGVELVELVNEFAELFWSVKEVATYRATCPYPPALETVYPKLD